MRETDHRNKAELPYYLQSGYIDWKKEYREKCSFLEEYYVEVDYRMFYECLFPPETIESSPKDQNPNPILTYCKYLREDGSPGMVHETIYNDYKTLELVRDNKFALVGMCAYSGAAPTAKNAYRCHGLCIDLDDVTCKNLQNVLYMVYDSKIIPVPQYITVSGAGIHIYYVFQDPVPLYSCNREALNRLKLGLSHLLWNPHTTRKLTNCSTETEYQEAFQFQNIYQRYRAVGSKSKLAWKTQMTRKSKYVIRAFRISLKKTEPEELMHYVDEAYRVEIKTAETPGMEANRQFSGRDQRSAADRWTPNTYIQNRGLYIWWMKTLKDIAQQGNRYYCLLILFAMAKKANVSYKEVYEDAKKLIPTLDARTQPGQRSFDWKDLKSASRFYNERSILLSNHYIYLMTGYQVKGSIKRNGRNRKEHMQYMTECRKAASYENVGRPVGSDKRKVVQEWRREHPEGTKQGCIRETGLSKPTVYKWWE